MLLASSQDDGRKVNSKTIGEISPRQAAREAGLYQHYILWLGQEISSLIYESLALLIGEIGPGPYNPDFQFVHKQLQVPTQKFQGFVGICSIKLPLSSWIAVFIQDLDRLDAAFMDLLESFQHIVGGDLGASLPALFGLLNGFSHVRKRDELATNTSVAVSGSGCGSCGIEVNEIFVYEAGLKWSEFAFRHGNCFLLDIFTLRIDNRENLTAPPARKI